MTTVLMDFETRRQELRALIKTKQADYEESALAAFTAADQKPVAAALRQDIVALEAELEEVTTAERTRDRKWHAQQAADEAAQRAAAIRAATTFCSRSFDRAHAIGREIGEGVQALNARVAELREIESGWRSAIWPLLTTEAKTRGPLVDSASLIGAEVRRLDAALQEARLSQGAGWGYDYAERLQARAASTRGHVLTALEKAAEADEDTR